MSSKEAYVSEYGTAKPDGTKTASNEYGSSISEYGSAMDTGLSEYGSAGVGVSEYGSTETGVSEYGSKGVSEYGSLGTDVSGYGSADAFSRLSAEHRDKSLNDGSNADVSQSVDNEHVKPGTSGVSAGADSKTTADEFLPYVASSGSSDSEEERKDGTSSRPSSPHKSRSRSGSRSSASSRSRSPTPAKDAPVPSGSAVTKPVEAPKEPFAFGRSRSRSGSPDRRRRRLSPRRHRSRSHSPGRRRRSSPRRRRRRRSRDRHRRHRRRRSRSPRGRSRSRERKPSRGHERRRSRDRHRPRGERGEKVRYDEHGKLSYKDHLKMSLINAQKQMEKSGKLDPETNRELGHFLGSSKEKPSKLPLYDDPLMAVTGGVEIDDKVSPQMAFIHSMQEMHRKAQELTGVAVPKYYNPAAVNPLKYAEQVQKRKLLWSKAKEEKTEATPAPTWQAVAKAMEKECDGKQSDKFKKLMGIRGASVEADGAPESETPEAVEIQKKQSELFSQLDKEYEFARMTTHTHRGIGLGFSSHYQAFMQAQQQPGRKPNETEEPPE